ncbi:hypothetical protein [Alkalihalobacillus sp. 1P02AB]|uniref:hypothetical protein n=1 Tax=Alkalihalobacillus sp. 1P02AB TaxID=3132260 RepID=UPI0039A54600
MFKKIITFLLIAYVAFLGMVIFPNFYAFLFSPAFLIILQFIQFIIIIIILVKINEIMKKLK